MDGSARPTPSRRTAATNATSGTPPPKRYGRAWQRIRDRYAAAHPFCEECYKRGVLTPTEEIHHIKPLAHGGNHADDNLMALCKPCHSRITVEMGDRWPQNKEYTY